MLTTTKWSIALLLNATLLWLLLAAYFRIRDDDFKDVCHTTDCKMDAESLLASMDKSVDPCDNFYQFACGGWIRNQAVPGEPLRDYTRRQESREKWEPQTKYIIEGPSSEDDPSPVKAMKVVYKTCMDVDQLDREGIQPLVDLSNALGGWPMAMKSWDEEEFQLQKILAEFNRRVGWFPMIRYVKKIDERTILTHNPLLTLYTDDYSKLKSLLSDAKSSDKMLSYKRYISETAFEVAKTWNHTISIYTLTEDTNLLVKFEKSLANLTSNGGPSKPNLITLKELQFLTNSYLQNTSTVSRFDWLAFLNDIWGEAGLTLEEDDGYQKHDEDFEFLSLDINYLDGMLNLVRLFEVTPPRVIANFIHWRLIEYHMGETTTRMRELKCKYDQLLYGKECECRSTTCETLTKEIMHQAYGYEYIRSFHFARNKAAVEDIFNTTRSAFIQSIEGSEWLDEDAKAYMTDQARNMTMMMYPDWSVNASALIDYYKEMNVSQQHFKNMLNFKTFEHRHYLRRIIKYEFNNSYKWDFLPIDDDSATFLHNINIFVIGRVDKRVQTPPILRIGRLGAINYGSFGYTAANKMTLGYISNESFRLRFTFPHRMKSTSELYPQLAECFIEQYSSYRVPELDKFLKKEAKINVTASLTDFIVDGASLNTAYAAYQDYVKIHGPEQRLVGLEEYTPDQLFFISYASELCETESVFTLQMRLVDDKLLTAEHRVGGSIANSQQFAQAFSCPLGANMNPKKKCVLW